MNTFLQDLRFGARLLRKQPGFTLLIVFTLALGIGANTAVYSLVDRLLVQTLPVREPAALMQLQAETVQPKLRFNSFSWADFQDYRAQNQVFSELTAFAQTPVNLGEGQNLERVRAAAVAENYFGLLGVTPLLGRSFSADENRTPGAHPVAVLSHSLWRSRFGGNAAVLGQTVTLNGQPYTIIGIAPANFHGLTLEAPTDVWVPAMMRARLERRKAGDEWLTDREASLWDLLGRIKPGVAQTAAQAALDTLAQQIQHGWMPASDWHLPFNERHILLTAAGQGLSSVRNEWSETLLLLFGLVGLILLIACANVANLLLVRASQRRKEIAVRLALGAGRGRLITQLLTESCLLAGLGGVAGVWLAPWLTDLLLAYQTKVENPGLVLTAGVNWRTAGFTLAVTLLTALLFGLLPAWQAAQPDLIPALKGESRQRADRASFNYARRSLIVAQVALSVVVVLAAGLFVRSLNKLFAIDPGFNPNNVLVAQLELPQSQYNEAQAQQFFQQLRERLQALPGAQAVALAGYTPLANTIGLSTVAIEGQNFALAQLPTVDVNQVSAGYHELMGIAVPQGRSFSEQDRQGQPNVVLINEAFAKKFFPQQNPVGRLISEGPGKPWRQIIGVTRNIKTFSLKGSDRPQMEYPLAQQDAQHSLRVLVRANDPATLLPLVRREVRALDAGLAFFKTTTLQDDLRATLAVWRMAATLTSLFGLIALVLAAVGLHGLLAYAVSQRTREIGIRMALGAQTADVLRLILRESVALIALGLACGLVAARALSRFIESMLYGVRPTDPLTLGATVAALTLVALLACWWPARRATRIEPMLALRDE